MPGEDTVTVPLNAEVSHTCVQWSIVIFNESEITVS